MADDEYLDAFIQARQRQANSNVALAADANPDDAARAFQLESLSGVPAPVIAGNLREFDSGFKARSSQQLVGLSTELQKYIAANPLHAQISNDDYPNLINMSDRISDENAAIGGFSFEPGAPRSKFLENTADVYKELWTSLSEGPKQFKDIAETTKQFLLKQGYSEEQASREADHIGGQAYRGEVIQNLLWAAPTAIAGPAIGAYRTFVAQPLEEAGGPPAQVTETFTMAALAALGMRHMVRPEVAALADKIEPYLKDGKVPPTGLDPVVDQVKAQQAPVDLAQLQKMEQAAQASTTRERNPEIFADFLRQHEGMENATIGIPADAVAGLYGGKGIAPDDGLLGWVPGLQEKLQLALSTGADVQIPLADWLAKVDPAVSKGLEQAIRVRPDGMTMEEAALTTAKAAEPKGIEGWHGSPYEFEAFNDEKIGTGEGAQSYGHGLYFAENPEVASTYNKPRTGGGMGFVGKMSNLPTGNIYRVRIHADREAMLDWDRPLAEQSSQIQAAMQTIADKYSIEFNPASTGEGIINRLRREPKVWRQLTEEESQGIYPKGTVNTESGDVAASARLKEAGIPGIRYLDQGSRGALRIDENPTSNFVIFDPSLIEIVDRNGEAVRSVREAAKLGPILQAYHGSGDVIQQFDPAKTRLGRGIFFAEKPELASKFAEGRATDSDALRMIGEDSPQEIKQWATKLVGEAEGKRIGELVDRADELGKKVPEDFNMPEYDAAAEAYTEAVNIATEELKRISLLDPELGQSPNVTKAQLDLGKSYEYDFGGSFSWDKEAEAIEFAKQNGYDSVTFSNSGEEGKFYSVFKKEQIKTSGVAEIAGQKFEKPEWMTVAYYNRYMPLIEQRRQLDVQKATERAAARIRERESPAWRQHEAEVRTEVVDEIGRQGPFAADEYFREGILAGQKVERVRIGEEFLSEEQKAALPASFVTKTGVDPGEVATLLGYRSGDELVFALAQLHAERVASGKNAPAFRRAFVEAETQRRVEERFGDFSQKVLDEAKEQALSEVQMDILHNDVHALAMAIGKQFLHEDGRPVTRGSFQSAVREMWERSKVGDYTEDKLLAVAGRAGRAVEDALLKKDYAEAFRQRQRQYISVQMAKEAGAFEKAKGKFETLAERYEAPVRKGTEQVYTNFIHDLLSQSGFKVRMTPDQIARAKGMEGYSLDEFVADRMSFGEELSVPSGYAPGLAERMTVGEYSELMAAIRTLDKAGRDAGKIEIAGAKQDREAFRAEVEANLTQRPIRDPEEIKRGGSWLYRLDAPATRAEEIIKDLDLRQELGPMYNALIRPYELSKAKSYDMMDALSKKLKDIKGFGKEWRRDLHKPVAQDFIHDTWYDRPYDLDRWGMVKMMLNWGNESNAAKLAEGIARAKLGPQDKATPDMIGEARRKINDLFQRNATKEDWNFVQHIWDIFKGWEKDIDTLTYNLSGETVKLIDPQEVATPFGTKAGGYFPLIPDKQRPLQGKVMVEKEAPAGNGPIKPGYFRATTNQAHLVERTGAKYFVDLASGPEQMVGRMQQIIHDLSYRDFAVNGGKVLYDPKIRHLVEKHYGSEYLKALDGWFERVINNRNVDERALQGWNSVAKQVGDNLVFAALPMNYAVVLSPSLGAFNPVSFLRFHANHAANMDFVMKQSKELPHVLYSIDRDVTLALNTLSQDGKWSAFQKHASEVMLQPLTWMEQQFRAVTFWDEFQKAKANGRTDGEAGILADSAVRERHSVAAVGDLSALRAHPNQFMRLATLFMGYFESQRNWLRQAPDQVRQGDYSGLARTLYGTVGIAAAYNLALFTKWKENDSWFSYVSRAVASVPLQMLPFVKDVWGYVSEGFTPKNPIVNVGIAAADLGKDGWDWFFKNKQPKSPIRHGFNLAGQAAGVPGAVQIGRTAQGISGLRQGTEPPPRSIAEWTRLILQGHTKPPKR